MDLQKLITFIDLTTTQNYTETAARLFMAQSTVSKHIQALEKELGAPLFVRNRHALTLTSTGKTLLPHAQNMVHEYRQLQAALRDTAQNVPVKIGTIPTIANYRGLASLTKFHHDYPAIKLAIEEMEADTLWTGLADGTIDLGFIRLFPGDAPAADVILGESDQMVVVLPKTHPLAKQPTLTMGDLRHEDFLLLGATSHLFKPVLAQAAAAGFKPHIVYQGRRVDLILDLITSGMGIAVMMAGSTNLTDYPNLVKRPLIDGVTSQLAFVKSRANHTAATTKIWQYLRQTRPNQHSTLE